MQNIVNIFSQDMSISPYIFRLYGRVLRRSWEVYVNLQGESHEHTSEISENP